jgi:glycosyltransferase involved in cell wall biosynthesis
MLESFYGGSHRDVADGIVRHSRHKVDLMTLPDRFWKWRMRGAALWFADKIKNDAAVPGDRWDLLLCTGLMDIASLKSLLGPSCPRVLLYCHETQLAYPSPRQTDADLHFAFTDLTNILAADRTLFNSQSHLTRYLESLPGFLRRFPEYRPMWAPAAVRDCSSVCYPGIAPVHYKEAQRADPPLIIWNHRWEFDKNPYAFFAALTKLAADGREFQVALLGENYQTVPDEFTRAREELGPRIVRYGYEPSRTRYNRWLALGSVVVSTAIQENFGISVMEAIAAGCHPVLPNRLSYPELIPEQFHGDVLYEDEHELVQLLRRAVDAASAGRASDGAPSCTELVAHANSFQWPQRISEFDEAMADTAAGVSGRRATGG